MTEVEAKTWIREHFGASRENQLADFVALLVEEATLQNLISAATIDAIWARHIVDSAQLIGLAAQDHGLWVDIGTGAGLPGLVVALLTDRPTVLIEPRRLRAEFLLRAATKLCVADRVSVIVAKSISSTIARPASVISARAVAPLPALLAGALHLASRNTLWLLPKGRTAQSEVAAARATWQAAFHVEPSITDPSSGIIVARGVHRR